MFSLVLLENDNQILAKEGARGGEVRRVIGGKLQAAITPGEKFLHPDPEADHARYSKLVRIK